MPQTPKHLDASRTDSRTRPLLSVIATAVSTATSLDLLLMPLLREITGQLGASVTILHRIDRERRELFAAVEHLPGIAEIRSPLGQGIAGRVAADGAALASHRVPDANARAGKEAWMAVPILSRAAPGHGLVIGVLEAIGSERPGRFQDEELARFQQLATEVGDALVALQLDDSSASPTRYCGMVGQSTAMQELYGLLHRASLSRSAAVLVGGPGTGKRLAARAIHASSPERHDPWIAMRPESLPASLAEHALFDRSVGALSAAAGGTLYIEHITTLPPGCQERLADSLRSGELAATRLLASTNSSLAEEVTSGRFHPELASSLLANTIELPDLHARGLDDMGRLVHYWIRGFARQHDRPARAIDSPALRYLHHRDWPAQLRELRQWIEASVLTAPEAVLGIDDVNRGATSKSPNLTHAEIPSGLSLAEVEERYIQRTLAEHKQNRTRAARALSIGRNTLVRKLKEYKS